MSGKGGKGVQFQGGWEVGNYPFLLEAHLTKRLLSCSSNEPTALIAAIMGINIDLTSCCPKILKLCDNLGVYRTRIWPEKKNKHKNKTTVNQLLKVDPWSEPCSGDLPKQNCCGTKSRRSTFCCSSSCRTLAADKLRLVLLAFRPGRRTGTHNQESQRQLIWRQRHQKPSIAGSKPGCRLGYAKYIYNMYIYNIVFCACYCTQGTAEGSKTYNGAMRLLGVKPGAQAWEACCRYTTGTLV